MNHHDQLRAMRAAAGMTQRDLAERLGMTHAAVGNIERAQHSTSVEMAKRWAAECGFRMDFVPDSSLAPDPEVFDLVVLLMQAAQVMGRRERALLRAQFEASLSFRED